MLNLTAINPDKRLCVKMFVWKCMHSHNITHTLTSIMHQLEELVFFFYICFVTQLYYVLILLMDRNKHAQAETQTFKN